MEGPLHRNRMEIEVDRVDREYLTGWKVELLQSPKAMGQ
jgi:hypothetical protein